MCILESEGGFKKINHTMIDFFSVLLFDIPSYPIWYPSYHGLYVHSAHFYLSDYTFIQLKHSLTHQGE